MTFKYMDERDDRPKRGEWNGDSTWEEIRVCPVCLDVDCTVHAGHEEASVAERALEDSVRAAAVVAAARFALSAWDVSEGTPRRLAAALSDLSDALAKYDNLPF